MRAIRETNRAEQDLADTLLSSLAQSIEGGEILNEPVVQRITTSIGQELTITLTTFVAAANTGASSMPIAVEDPSGEISVDVPLAVLSQVTGGGSAPVAIAAGVLPINFANALQNVGFYDGTPSDPNATEEEEEGLTLAAPPIQITIYDADGNPLEGIQLDQPITIQLASDANESVGCAYFNEVEKKWSVQGVRRVFPPADPNASTSGEKQKLPLTCETDHLSIFGGVNGLPKEVVEAQVAVQAVIKSVKDEEPVIDLIAQAAAEAAAAAEVIILKCTRGAFFFSEAGLAALSSGNWILSSPAIAVWALLTCFAVAVMAAKVWDQLRFEDKWKWQLSTMWWKPDPNFKDEDDVEPPEEDQGRAVVNYCALALHALQAGIDMPTLELAIATRSIGSKLGWKLKRTKSPLYKALLDLAEEANVASGATRAVDLFLRARWSARILLLFPAMHNAVSVPHASLLYSRTSRVMMIFTKLTIAAGITALLFQSATSTGLDSDPDCIPFAGLLTTILLGIIAAMLGDTAVHFLSNLRSHKFQEARGNHELKKIVRDWRLRNLAFWMLCIIFMGVSCYSVCVFIASVIPTDADAWVAAFLLIILEEFFFLPFLQAVILATLATYILEADKGAAATLRHLASNVTNPRTAWEMKGIEVMASGGEGQGEDAVEELPPAPPALEEDHDPRTPTSPTGPRTLALTDPSSPTALALRDAGVGEAWPETPGGTALPTSSRVLALSINRPEEKEALELQDFLEEEDDELDFELQQRRREMELGRAAMEVEKERQAKLAEDLKAQRALLEEQAALQLQIRQELDKRQKALEYKEALRASAEAAEAGPGAPPKVYERQPWQDQNRNPMRPAILQPPAQQHFRQGIQAQPRNQMTSSTSVGLQRTVKGGQGGRATVMRSQRAAPPPWPPPSLRPPADMMNLVQQAGNPGNYGLPPLPQGPASSSSDMPPGRQRPPQLPNMPAGNSRPSGNGRPTGIRQSQRPTQTQLPGMPDNIRR